MEPSTIEFWIGMLLGAALVVLIPFTVRLSTKKKDYQIPIPKEILKKKIKIKDALEGPAGAQSLETYAARLEARANTPVRSDKIH